MSRKANVEIIKLLLKYFIKHPTHRFHQALVNTGLVRKPTFIKNRKDYWINEYFMTSEQALGRMINHDENDVNIPSSL